VFNGSRFRAEIVPKINDFIATHQRRKGLLARSFSRMS
jgi:poly-beta-hydroxyalkanoate depolymerase